MLEINEEPVGGPDIHQEDHNEYFVSKSKKRLKRKTPKTSHKRLSSTSHLEQHVRSLSRERNFIVYDNEFIEEMKHSVDYQPQASVYAGTPKHHSTSQSKPARHNSVSYNEINQKKKQALSSKRLKEPVTPKRNLAKPRKERSSDIPQTNFRHLFPDAKKLMEIRRAHLNYSLNSSKKHK